MNQFSFTLSGCGYAVGNLLSIAYPRRVHNGTLSMPLKKGNISNHKDDNKLGRFMTMRQVYGVSSHEIINTQPKRLGAFVLGVKYYS